MVIMIIYFQQRLYFFYLQKTRFKNSSTNDDWTSGWSTGWSSGDWKKKDTEDYRNGYPVRFKAYDI